MYAKIGIWKSEYFYVALLSSSVFLGSVSLRASDEQDFSNSRSGVVLLKKYEQGDWAILLGEKAHTSQEWKSVNFPAGKYDAQDNRNLENTAIREMKEETGSRYSPLSGVTSDMFYKTWTAFNSGKQVPPYIDNRNRSGHIRLYFLDVTSMSDVGQRSLSRAVKSAIGDPHLPSDCKEVGNYWAVPMRDFFAAAYGVYSTRSNTAENRRVKSRGSQQKLQMESHYMGALSGKIHEFRKILQGITGQDPHQDSAMSGPSTSFSMSEPSTSFMPAVKTLKSSATVLSPMINSNSHSTSTTTTTTTSPGLMSSFYGEPESVIREALRNLEASSYSEFRDEIQALKALLPSTSGASSLPIVPVLSPLEQEIADLKALPSSRLNNQKIARLEQQLQLSNAPRADGSDSVSVVSGASTSVSGQSGVGGMNTDLVLLPSTSGVSSLPVTPVLSSLEQQIADLKALPSSRFNNMRIDALEKQLRTQSSGI